MNRLSSFVRFLLNLASSISDIRGGLPLRLIGLLGAPPNPFPPCLLCALCLLLGVLFGGLCAAY